MDNLTIDDLGNPILLADVPNSGTSTTDPDAASGNPKHDTNSGKFASGSEQGNPVENVPANVEDVQSYYRQMDAVRDMAREIDSLEGGDIQDLLSGRLQRPLEEAELVAFVQRVREHKLNDLVDILDYQFRSLIDSIKRGRRRVKVTAPKGYIRKVFGTLTDDEIVSIFNRLEARGHKREDLQRSLLGRIRGSKRQDGLATRLADIPENDDQLELDFTVEEQVAWDEWENEGGSIDDSPVTVNVYIDNKPMETKSE